MARQETLRKRSRQWIGGLMRRLNAEQKRKLYLLAGSRWDFSRIDDNVWREFERKVRDEFRATVLIVYLLSFEELRRIIPIDMYGYPIDRRRDQMANDWARTRSENFAKDYVENTTRWVSELEAKAQESGTPTKQEVDDVTKRAFGIERSDRVAMTEGNEAITEGEKGYAEEVNTNGPGIKLLAVWKHHDHRPPGHSRAAVNPCKICSPLEGLKQGAWPKSYEKGPPAHPHCDCHLEWEIIPQQSK